MSLDLYSIFHLNLSYSSIEKSDRRKVIDKCYWPLIEIAKKITYLWKKFQETP